MLSHAVGPEYRQRARPQPCSRLSFRAAKKPQLHSLVEGPDGLVIRKTFSVCSLRGSKRTAGNRTKPAPKRPAPAQPPVEPEVQLAPNQQARPEARQRACSPFSANAPPLRRSVSGCGQETHGRTRQERRGVSFVQAKPFCFRL